MTTLEIARVRPFSESTVSSAAAAPLSSLPFTFFDFMWLKFHPIQRAFLFQVPNLTRSHFDSVILPRLKTSLSLTLLHFLPLAGRLVWGPQDPKPYISYSRDGDVFLTVAESDADMSRLASDEPRPASLLRPLVPELQESARSSPIITLQVTFFPNQGFSIGITSHHAIMDGTSTTMFVKAWAHMCRTETTRPSPLPEDLTPFFDRTGIRDPNGLEDKFLNVWMSLDPRKNLELLPHGGVNPELIRATFELTREQIGILRDRVKSESTDPSQLRLSTFVLAYAYVLTCLVQARGGDVDRPVAVAFAADYRTRCDPPVPANYFGNCVGGGGNIDSKAGNFMGEKGLLAGVEKMSGFVSNLDLKALESIVDFIGAMGRMKPDTQFVSVSGSNRFGVYKSDFGWGRPEKVEIVSIDTNKAFSMAESRLGNGGVEIGVCLEPREFESFRSLFLDGLKNI